MFVFRFVFRYVFLCCVLCFPFCVSSIHKCDKSIIPSPNPPQISGHLQSCYNKNPRGLSSKPKTLSVAREIVLYSAPIQTQYQPYPDSPRHRILPAAKYALEQDRKDTTLYPQDRTGNNTP